MVVSIDRNVALSPWRPIVGLMQLRRGFSPESREKRLTRSAASGLGVQIALPDANAINSIDRSTRQAGNPETAFAALSGGVCDESTIVGCDGY